MNKKEKKLHIGSLDSVKGFKNISLDLNTYERIFNLSQNNNSAFIYRLLIKLSL